MTLSTHGEGKNEKNIFAQKLIITRAWEILMRDLVYVCMCVYKFSPPTLTAAFPPHTTPKNNLLSLSAFLCFCNFRQSSFKDFSSLRLFSHMKNCGEIIFFAAAQEFICGNFPPILKANFFCLKAAEMFCVIFHDFLSRLKSFSFFFRPQKNWKENTAKKTSSFSLSQDWGMGWNVWWFLFRGEAMVGWGKWWGWWCEVYKEGESNSSLRWF